MSTNFFWNDSGKKFLKDLNRDIGIVHRVCNSFFDREDAAREDLFQEVMYQLWKSYSTFNGDSKFSTWVYRVAFNTAITHARKLNREPERTELKEMHHPVSETDKQAQEHERLRLLYSAIRSLREIDRVIILLYIPFTAIMMKKFKAMCRSKSYAGQTIRQFLKHQYKLLSEFFRFKRWFDWIGVPVTAIILVMILFSLYVSGGVEENPAAGIFSFIAVIAILFPFIHAENRKSFIEPLKVLESLIREMDENPEN